MELLGGRSFPWAVRARAVQCIAEKGTQLLVRYGTISIPYDIAHAAAYDGRNLKLLLTFVH